MESLVSATQRAPWPGMQAEHRSILETAEQPMSLVEIGAALQIPVGVARVLVSDLAGAGYVAVHEPEPTGTTDVPGPPCWNACWRVYMRADRRPTSHSRS